MDDEARRRVTEMNMKTTIVKQRLTQREAMRYVGIGVWTAFEKWVELRKIPYSSRGRQKLFRISELEKAMVADEEATARAHQKGLEAAAC